MGFLSSILGGGVVQSLEKVALEVIETDRETAEAKALMVKTLDPNGVMRRDIMRFIRRVYGFYLGIAVILIFMSSFSFGDVEAVESAFAAVTEIFVPITSLFGALTTASFGVNGVNSWKGEDKAK